MLSSVMLSSAVHNIGKVTGYLLIHSLNGQSLALKLYSLPKRLGHLLVKVF
jgi:hypothetical protein